MKARKFSKKLILNKKTIANLNNGEMRIAYGGAPTQVAEHPATETIPPECPIPPDPTSCVCTVPITGCTC